MSILPKNTDFSDRDFDSLLRREQNLVRSVFPDWTDFNTASFGNILLELFAFVGENLVCTMLGMLAWRQASAETPTGMAPPAAVRPATLERPAEAIAHAGDRRVRTLLSTQAIVGIPEFIGLNVTLTAFRPVVLEFGGGGSAETLSRYVMAGAALSLERRRPPHFQGGTIDLLALAGYRHLQAPVDGPHLVTVVGGVDINIWVASHLGLSVLLRGGLGRDLSTDRPMGEFRLGVGLAF